VITSSINGATVGDVHLPAQRQYAPQRAPADRPRSAAPAPAPRRRLLGVDATRGVALVGMMAVHALYVVDADGQPTVAFSLFAGRAAAVFAVLAGVGVAFLTGRRRVTLGRPVKEAAAALVARGLVVGVIGLALGYTDPEIATVILPYYAALFLIAVPLVLLPTSVLVALGAAVAAGMPFLSHMMRRSLPVHTATNHSFVDLVTDPLGTTTELLVTGEYPVLSWTAYLCVGIAVGRLRLSSPRIAVALLATGTVAAAGGAALSMWLLGPMGGLAHILAAGTGNEDVPVSEILAFGADGVTPTTSIWWLAVWGPHTGTPPDLLHTTGTAVALLGALLLLGHVKVPALRRIVVVVLAPLAAAGSMTLTLYTAHVVFMNSPLDTFDAVPGYVVQVVTALLFALAWWQAVGRGPLESAANWAAGRARRAVGGARSGANP
jgi:uncharacterized membrane protein